MEVAELQTMLLPGDEIGCYRIESFLGKGGFGVTYLALDTMLNMQVAVKEYMPEQLATRASGGSVRPKSSNDAELFSWGLSRFIKEAQTLARFNHPNIVRVMAVFEQNGTAYMVMEYERGKDLKLQLRHQEFRTQQNLTRIVGPIIDGLDEVHRLGYIHRDIKPANILIRNNGTPVLLDFGSARLAIGSQTQNLTALVSVGYAPLEQYNSSNDNQQGPWTDIYALGAVLYYAITGNAPVDSTLRGSAVLNDKPDPLQPLEQLAPAGFNKSFCQAIDWALNFKVADRPSNLGEWRARLLADDATVLMPSVASRKIQTQSGEPITPEIVNTSQPRYFTNQVPGTNSPASGQTRTSERRAPQREAANAQKRPTLTDDEDWDTSSIGSKVYANQQSQVKSKESSNKALIYSFCLLLAIGAGAVALYLNGLLPVPFLEPSRGSVQTELNDQALVQQQQLAEQEAQAQLERERVLEQQRQLKLEQERQLKLEQEQAAAEEQRNAELERQRAAAELEQQRQQALEQEQKRQAEAEAEARRKAEEAERQATIEKRRLEQEAERAKLEEQARQENLERQRQEALDAQRAAEAELAEQRRAAELKKQAEERALAEQAAQAAAQKAALEAEQKAAQEAAREAALKPKIDSSIPITDRDIAAVWDQFKSLTTAIEEKDGQALRRLTDESTRKYNYFDYVFKTFEQIDVSISNIQASRLDQTVRGTLNISRMKRSNGDMAFPPAEFKSIPISAVRYDEWSKIKW